MKTAGGTAQPRGDLVGYAALLALPDPWRTVADQLCQNKAYLEEVDAKVPQLEQQSKALQNQPQRDLFALLPLL